MRPRAVDRIITCCERNGFRSDKVQKAPQWPALVRLAAAGWNILTHFTHCLKMRSQCVLEVVARFFGSIA
jgi:hypothetical protein